MAEKSNCSRLLNLRKSIKQADLHQEEIIAGPFVILKICRYFADPLHVSQTGLEIGSYIDAYQLTVTDKINKLKVVLSPELFMLIQKRKLREGCSVTFTKCSLRYDESDLSGRSIIIVHCLNIDNSTCLVSLSQEMASVPWCPDCSNHETKDLPLSSSRGYYLDLWSSMEMSGDMWKHTGEECKDIGTVRAQDVYQIKDISKRWSEFKSVNPHMILMVISRCRLLHYAKPGKSDKWPFQAHFSVCDKTGVCNMILWNSMCAEYYHRISEGSVILIRRFTVKKSFYSSGREVQLPKDLEYYDVDLNLNPHHPSSELQILAPSAIPKEIQLPTLEYNFAERRHLGYLPNDFICDVVGCVTFVGRYERDAITNKSGQDSGGFWIRRWIHLKDATSSKPFIVEMFRAAESAIVDVPIEPGMVLVCRHMRVINGTSNLTGSKHQRPVYVTSTSNTQVYAVDRDTMESLKATTAVKNVLEWSNTDEGKQEVELSLVGGYFSYPFLPAQLSFLQDIYTDLKIVSSDDWEKEVTGLCYRQHKRLFVQAVLVTAKLVRQKDRETISPIPKRQSPRKKSSKRSIELPKPLEDKVIVDKDICSVSDQMVRLGTTDPLQISATFPVPYNKLLWPQVCQQVEFPSGSLKAEDTTRPDSETQTRDVPDYLVLTWTGLNSQVLLNTVWRPKAENFEGVNTLSDLLCKEQRTLHWIIHPLGVQTKDLLEQLQTATQCEGQRFLLVVDCYKPSSDDYQELVLNHAYKV